MSECADLFRRRSGSSRILCAAFCLAFVAAASGLAAAEIAAEYQLKAEFLERFTRFIEWPLSSTVSNASAPFVIIVVGRDPFGRYLDEMAASHRIKGKPIQVKRVASADKITDCDLLFISSSESGELQRILDRTESKPILTVSDTEGFGGEGVLINFFTEGDKVRFEINQAAVERSGLRINSKLLKLARVIEREGT